MNQSQEEKNPSHPGIPYFFLVLLLTQSGANIWYFALILIPSTKEEERRRRRKKKKKKKEEDPEKTLLHFRKLFHFLLFLCSSFHPKIERLGSLHPSTVSPHFLLFKTFLLPRPHRYDILTYTSPWRLDIVFCKRSRREESEEKEKVKERKRERDSR